MEHWKGVPSWYERALFVASIFMLLMISLFFSFFLLLDVDSQVQTDLWTKTWQDVARYLAS